MVMFDSISEKWPDNESSWRMSVNSRILQLPPLVHHDRRDDNNNHQCIIRLHRKRMLLAMNLLSDGNFAKMGEFVEMR